MTRALPFVVVGLAAVLVVVTVATAPKAYDPRLRAERAGTEPFDAEALYRLLPAWLGAPVVPVDVTPFEHLADTALVGTAYVFVTGAFAPDAAEAERLAAYVERGNTVVVAAHALDGPLFEAVGEPPDRPGQRDRKMAGDDGGRGLRTEWGADFLPETLGSLDAPDSLRLAGQARPVAFPVGLGGARLAGLDAARTATIATTLDGYPTAVAVALGRGRVVVLSTPIAFTNAALTGAGDGAAFLAGVFAYVPPVRRVFWDETHKPLREGGGSRLRYAVRTPPLRWALGTIALGALLAVVFLGRRRQRPIPVAAAPPNAQREFARTVGRLFFVRGDRAWLARRKLRLFEDGLRTRLGLADADLSDQTAVRAAARAGVPEADAQVLFARLRSLSTDPAPAAADLLAADRDADAFLAARDAAPGGPV